MNTVLWQKNIQKYVQNWARRSISYKTFGNYAVDRQFRIAAVEDSFQASNLIQVIYD